MLSLDQVRVSVRKGEIKPRYVKEDDRRTLETARQLIEAFGECVGKPYGDLSEALKLIEGDNPRFQVIRGLAKLLHGRSEINVVSPMEPLKLRRKVFELSASKHPIGRVRNLVHQVCRRDVLEEIAAELGVEVEAVERGMYADLKEEQVVESFEPLTPGELLGRYNLALAQGVMMRASEMTIDIHLVGSTSAAQYRQLFRYLKFFQLLHVIRPRAGGGYRIVVDGPTSVLKNAGRYGFQMACFLPALLLCKGWAMEATVHWGTGHDRTDCSFTLSSEDGLKSHFQNRGVYLTEEEQMFIDRFTTRQEDWLLERGDVLLPLGGQGLLIPDFCIKHAEDGREAYFEVIGYWRADYLKRRLKLLRERGPSNLILAVSDRMRIEKKKLEAVPADIIFFKKVINPKLVVEALERVAVKPR